MKQVNVFVLVLGLLVSFGATAQLSERENHPTKFKVGTRPTDGNVGFSVVISNQDTRTWLRNDDTTKQSISLPLFVYKYYLSDDMVLRIGLKSDKEKTVREGDVDPSVNGLGGLTYKADNKAVNQFFITPAIEKHFQSSNILDPYIVATLPLGYLTEKMVTDRTYDYGDFTKNTMTKKSFGYGLGLHFGVQAFIADLPFAIGLELGGTGVGFRGEKYKHEVSSSLGGIETNQVYYTYKDDPKNVKFSDLKSNSFETNGDFRVTLNYFFRK